MSKLPFLERIRQTDRPLLGDGAMGTVLHARGNVAINACFDALNITQPDLVQGIHADYLAAGAELIETNTFGANRYKLAEHKLQDKVAEICRAGVELARRAIAQSGREDVYIAGSAGPLGQRLKPYGRITTEDARQAFAEQIGALAAAGVDVILLETFADHTEALEALYAAREVAPDVPVIVHTTFSVDDRTLLGYAPARVANDLYRAGADVIGVNCSGGPAQISQILQTIRQAVPEAFVSAMPNAGFPESVGGRVMFPATADYFGDYALTFKALGACVIGGCCGSTPEHIAAMRTALDDPKRPLPVIQVLDSNGKDEDYVPAPPTSLSQRLARGEFTVTVEVAPPRSYDVETLVQRARLLRDAGADILNVADSPTARMRMSPWAVCHIIQSQVGIETVLHFPTRGRNLLRIQGDLLAAHALDLRNLFVVMGDPTRIGDYPDAMDSYDIAPSRLIGLIKHEMNEGVDLAGNSIGKPTSFTVGCALNMGADDLDREIRILLKKLKNGADFALGQAVYEPSRVERFYEKYRATTGEDFTLPVLMGAIPLYSLKHARFLHNEVPGIIIPDSIFKRLEEAGHDAPQEGVRIAQELLAEMSGLIQGAYIIPAYGRYDLAAQVVDAVAHGTPRPPAEATPVLEQ